MCRRQWLGTSMGEKPEDLGVSSLSASVPVAAPAERIKHASGAASFLTQKEFRKVLLVPESNRALPGQMDSFPQDGTFFIFRHESTFGRKHE